MEDLNTPWAKGPANFGVRILDPIIEGLIGTARRPQTSMGCNKNIAGCRIADSQWPSGILPKGFLGKQESACPAG